MSTPRILPLLALLAPALAGAVPLELTHQGRLLDASAVPLDGDHEITFTLYASPAGGAGLWTETHELDFDGGYYSAVLGAIASLDSALVGDTLWLGLSVDDGPELPSRLPLTSVPYAVVAGTAEVAESVIGDVDATSVVVGGKTVIDTNGEISWSSISDAPTTLSDIDCASDQVLRWSGFDWACGDLDHTHVADDIVSGTLAIGRLPVGAGSDEVAAGDHAHDAGAIVTGEIDFARLPVGDGATQVAQGDHDHGASLEGLSCSKGDSPTWSGSAWTCDRQPTFHVIASPANVRLNCSGGVRTVGDIVPPGVPPDATAIIANVFTYHDQRNDHVNHSFGRMASHQEKTWDNEVYNRNTWMNDVIVTHNGDSAGSDFYGVSHGTQFIPLKSNGRFDAKLCSGWTRGTHYVTLQVNGYVQ